MMSDWEKIKIGQFLSPYRIEHIVQDDKNYRQVTISKNHGISFRGVKNGKNIGRKRQFILDLQKHPNTVVFTRQGVLDGAIGIAPLEVDKCIVTENMPMMSVDTSVIEMTYLKKLLVSDYLYQKIRLLKIVGSAQKSIHERDLLNVEIKLPNKKIQHDICNKFTVLDMEHSELEIELTHQQTLLKKLRQQILQEAIEGKLTKDWRAENPDVESASELLKRIQIEKSQLIKDKKIKPQKPLLPISEKEIPFELPDGWEWCRLGKTIYYAENLDIHKKFLPTAVINYVDINSIDNKQFMIKNIKIKKVSELSSRARRVLKSGYIVYSMVRPYLRNIAIVERNIANMIGSTGFSVFKPIKINKLFIFYFLLNPELNKKYEEMMVGFNSPSITSAQFENSLLPLPPLPEQKAIVAKVEKLLTLCDQLQTQITTNQTHAKQLMQAVLKEAFLQNSE